MPLLRLRPALALCLAGLCGFTSAANAQVDASDLEGRNRLRYALGAALIEAPRYVGGSEQQLKLRPLWALSYGRFHVNGARASGLLDAGGDSGSGVSADLLSGTRWRLGGALRLDSGRAADADPALAGLPSIRGTLRGRVFGNVDWGGGWSSSLGYSADLLGRGGGGVSGLALGYGWTPWPGLTAAARIGGNWADRQHMATYFGISPQTAAAAGRAAFEPSAGLMNLHAGLNLRMPLEGRWTASAGIGLSQLQGDAAVSPLTRSRQAASFSLGLAWRSP